VENALFVPFGQEKCPSFPVAALKKYQTLFY